jgi:hypothetical protein
LLIFPFVTNKMTSAHRTAAHAAATCIGLDVMNVADAFASSRQVLKCVRHYALMTQSDQPRVCREQDQCAAAEERNAPSLNVVSPMASSQNRSYSGSWSVHIGVTEQKMIQRSGSVHANELGFPI